MTLIYPWFCACIAVNYGQQGERIWYLVTSINYHLLLLGTIYCNAVAQEIKIEERPLGTCPLNGNLFVVLRNPRCYQADQNQSDWWSILSVTGLHQPNYDSPKSSSTLHQRAEPLLPSTSLITLYTALPHYYRARQSSIFTP